MSGFGLMRFVVFPAALLLLVLATPSIAATEGETTRVIEVAPGAQASAEPAEAAPRDRAPAHPANIGNPQSTKGPAPRLALVIGNSAYRHAAALSNPANDASAVSRLLNSAGFEVVAGTDLSREEMVQVLQDFAARIVERGPNTVALVYYAGHGLQLAGENYLVPVDAQISAEGEVPQATLRLVDVMSSLESVPSRMRIVILDACRNNPFAALGEAGRGLAIVDAPNGSIVAYSTAPGTEAYDGAGSNSPYTSAFLKLARTPNMPIEQFFKRVRLLVNDATEGRQTPWESSSLTSDFYFFTDNPQTASAGSTKPKSAYAVADIRGRPARQAYEIVIEEDSVEYYEEFVRLYPFDPLVARIRALLASRLMMLAWHKAVIANSPSAYEAFSARFAGSEYAKTALALKAQPKAVPLSAPLQIFKPIRVLPNVKLTNTPDGPQAIRPPVGANAGQVLSPQKADLPSLKPNLPARPWPPVQNGAQKVGQPAPSHNSSNDSSVAKMPSGGKILPLPKFEPTKSPVPQQGKIVTLPPKVIDRLVPKPAPVAIQPASRPQVKVMPRPAMTQARPMPAEMPNLQLRHRVSPNHAKCRVINGAPFCR